MGSELSRLYPQLVSRVISKLNEELAGHTFTIPSRSI